MAANCGVETFGSIVDHKGSGILPRLEVQMKRDRLVRVAFCSVVAFALLAVSGLADYKQAIAYYNRGEFEKAIQELKPDLERNPDWESGHRLLGLCYLGLKNNALAVSSLARAVQLKSPAFSTYRGLAMAYFNMQRYEDCINALNQGESRATEGDKYALFHLRGSAYFRQNKYSEALNDLTSAIRINQSEWTDFSQLGICYFQLGRIDEAIQTLQKTDSMKSGQPVIAEYLGKAYFKKGVAALGAKQYPQATENLQKARDYSPKDGYTCFNLGEAYVFQKNFAAAEKAYAQAMDLLPKNPDVYNRMGLVYENLKKWDQALTAYQKANELAPSPKLKEAITRVTEAKKAKM
jgi:tetratricopeptide (TPR) repeat protein